jgi:hypothetical protein
MVLLADAVGLAKPGQQFCVQVFTRREAEGVDVIARGDGFDLRETWIFQAPVQHDVAHNAIASQAHRGETHAHLKGNARLFRHDAHGSAALDQSGEGPEQRDRARSFPGEMLAQRIA